MKTIPILYENDDILIINKQCGIAVQGGEGILHPLDELLAEQLHQKVYLVHRLDRATAGILVVAKNPVAATEYTKLFAGKQASKEYEAICIGCPPQKSGTIAASVAHKGTEKSAVTSYQVLASCTKELASVSGAATTVPVREEKTGGVASASNGVPQCITLSHVRLLLGTGRMHQIRIHLQSIHTPIAADDKYGDFKTNKLLKRAFGVQKLQLAAVRLTLPIEGKKQTFEIPLPEHMSSFLAQIF